LMNGIHLTSIANTKVFPELTVQLSSRALG
jgi:hypothetical protein